jgi:pilus assembly protein CpaF
MFWPDIWAEKQDEEFTHMNDGPLGKKAEWISETGPIERLLADPTVTEVMVNGPRSVFVERDGKIENAGVHFRSSEELSKIAVGLARAAGREVSRKVPCVDIRLPDGSRANIVVFPIAVDGPIITIRKAKVDMLDLRNLVQADFVNEKLLYFLNVCVASRVNLIVSGGTSTGKTTLLNALIGLIPSHERLVVIEDTLELNIKQVNVARLEAGVESTYDEGIETKKLVRNALRMRPDRIIVGECRGGEAWDILQAMNSGHEGSMTAIHANTSIDALRKMEALVLVEDSRLSAELVREHLAGILKVIVQIERDPNGHRHVSEVVEVIGLEGGEIQVQSIFRRSSKGLVSCNVRPLFARNLRSSPLHFPEDFFDEGKQIVLEGFSKK